MENSDIRNDIDTLLAKNPKSWVVYGNTFLALSITMLLFASFFIHIPEKHDVVLNLTSANDACYVRVHTNCDINIFSKNDKVFVVNSKREYIGYVSSIDVSNKIIEIEVVNKLWLQNNLKNNSHDIPAYIDTYSQAIGSKLIQSTLSLFIHQ